MAALDFLKMTQGQGAALGVTLDQMAQMFGRKQGVGTSLGRGLLQAKADKSLADYQNQVKMPARSNQKLGGADRVPAQAQQVTRPTNMGLSSFEYGALSDQQRTGLQARMRDIDLQNFDQQLKLKQLTQADELAKMRDASTRYGVDTRAASSKYGTDVSAGVSREGQQLSRENVLSRIGSAEGIAKNRLGYQYSALEQAKEEGELNRGAATTRQLLSNAGRRKAAVPKGMTPNEYATTLKVLQEQERNQLAREGAIDRLNKDLDSNASRFYHPITGVTVNLGLDEQGKQITLRDIQEIAQDQFGGTDPRSIMSAMELIHKQQTAYADPSMLMFEGIDESFPQGTTSGNEDVDIW